MPRLWTDTMDGHRRAVRDAALDAVGRIVHGQGLRGVTMTRVAELTGVGRATLYKYFPDVEALLLAWHERHLDTHMRQIAEIRGKVRDPFAALTAVLTEYALGMFHAGGDLGGELGVFLHSRQPVTEAHRQLEGHVRELIEAGAHLGRIRSDVAADELAAYALHAVSAAASARTGDTVRRLVLVTLAGLSATGGDSTVEVSAGEG